MTKILTHRNRTLCFPLILHVLLFCFPRRLFARNLPEEYTTNITQTIKVSNATRHDFSRLVDVQLGSHVSGVSELKRYLHRFGYVKDNGSDDSSSNFSDVFDGRLESAISLYQQNLGLPITGRLDTSTVTLMSSPRCGVSDAHMINNGSMHVTARYTYFGGKPKWNRDTLTYAFSETHRLDYLTSDDVKVVFRRAFGRWASVIPVSFKEVDDYTAANLKIGFFAGDHGDGQPFDGVLGILAHAFAPKNGRVHFDAAETWVVDDDFGSTVAVDLESVATHEIGHLLGLGHSSHESAVMYPTLPPRTKKVDLTVDDVAGVLKLYGANPKLRLDSLAQLKDSLGNGGVSERFLSGNVTGYALLVVLILFL
ncbi:Metalloendoproteinase 1-MMP [Hirschfeldia incana]|nr:Metalloendoproteinase 1-MMP [Hirschfeldia incana]